MGRHAGQRAFAAVAGVLAVDDVGLRRLLLGVADPELRTGVAGEAVDEHVRGGQQLVEERAALVPAQVEGDAALVLVDLDVRGAVLRGDLAEEAAQVVPHAGRLNLDHVGAEVGEQGAQGVAVEQHRGFEDTDAFE